MHDRTGRPVGIVALLIGLAAACCCANEQEKLAGILTCGLPGESEKLIESLAEEIEAAGWDVATASLDELTAKDSTVKRDFDLLVLPDGAHLPTSVAPAIERFARAGGKIIALQTPLWREPMIRT